MDIQAEKYMVIEELLKVEDINLITQLKHIIRNRDTVIASQSSGAPITETQMRSDILAAKERIQSGKYTTQDDIEKEAENW
ncbi:hypothetical protein [Reichenbachiella versicolor]|uniref:hypothetical protein n=1 Tax=Reichenbachiella versicolor TaxID=1821036 RepID=UPI000D6E926F|nr:hypothetical protein [Reichenbachiella versicolor]